MGRPPFPRPSKLRVIQPGNIGDLHDRITLPPIQGSVNEAAFSPNGSLVALAMGEDVLLHRTVNGDLVARLQVGWQQAISLAFHPGGTHLAVGGHNGSSLTIWDVASFAQVNRVAMQLPGTANWFQPASLAFSRSGNTLMAQGQDERVVLWNWNGGQPTLRRVLQWPGTFNGPLRTSLDGYWLGSARGNGEVGIYRYNLDGELERQPGSLQTGGQVPSIAFDGASKHMLYAGGPSATGHAELIRLEDGQIVRRFGKTAAEGGGQVLAAALSPAAPLLALSQGSSLQVPGQIHFHQTTTGNLLRSIDFTSSVIAFSPDGRRMIVANWAIGAASTVQIWTV